MHLVHSGCSGQIADISGAFGAFLVKTIEIYLLCGDYTHAALVHLVHSACSGQILDISVTLVRRSRFPGW